jgi:hypothetical protein
MTPFKAIIQVLAGTTRGGIYADGKFMFRMLGGQDLFQSLTISFGGKWSPFYKFHISSHTDVNVNKEHM